MMRRIAIALAVAGLAACSPAPDDAALVAQFATSLSTSAACNGGGYRACQLERLARAYPGALDEDAARSCIAAAQEDPKYRYTVAMVPGSLVATPEWVGPEADGSAEWLFAGRKPQGSTYEVALAVSDTYLGEDHTVTWTSHVTVRDGTVYWFPNIC